MVVVDASAVAAILFGEPEGPTLAAHLQDETLLAPGLLDFELMHVAVKKASRQPEARAQIMLTLHAMSTLPISRIAVPAAGVFTLAKETGLTAYDACYLWLARSRDAELVTLDRILVRASSQT